MERIAALAQFQISRGHAIEAAQMVRPRLAEGTGSVEAVCTVATITGEVASDVISQAAATSLMNIDRLAASQVGHSIRNTG